MTEDLKQIKGQQMAMVAKTYPDLPAEEIIRIAKELSDLNGPGMVLVSCHSWKENAAGEVIEGTRPPSYEKKAKKVEKSVMSRRVTTRSWTHDG